MIGWVATPAGAATISLGVLSFDEFIPGDSVFVGTNAFNIYNSTGDYAAPFDDGVPPNPITPISFNDASLLLTRADGGTLNLLLGTVAPGLLGDDTGNLLFTLQFAATESFVSAVFAATLSTQDFLFADGSTFHAAAPNLLYTLAATGGLVPNPLAPSLTMVPFELTGELAAPPTVPEPSTIVLLVSGLGLAGAYRARARAARRATPQR